MNSLREEMQKAGCSGEFISFATYLIGQREINWYGYCDFAEHYIEVTLQAGYCVRITD